MLMKMRSKMQNQKGFTLVELMVVVVILGVLVAIAVPIYNNVTESAKLNAHLANIRTIEGAIESYKAANPTATLSTINVTSAGVGVLSPSYIQEWPAKPGEYTVEDGVLTADPTKDATKTAADGGAAVIWP